MCGFIFDISFIHLFASFFGNATIFLLF